VGSNAGIITNAGSSGVGGWVAAAGSSAGRAIWVLQPDVWCKTSSLLQHSLSGQRVPVPLPSGVSVSIGLPGATCTQPGDVFGAVPLLLATAPYTPLNHPTAAHA
jgi:hypothetical protein